MKNLLYIFVLSIFWTPLFAQIPTSSPGIIFSPTGNAPSGACSAGVPGWFVPSTGAIWTCQDGIWTMVGGGGSTITCTTSGGIVYWNGTAYVCYLPPVSQAYVGTDANGKIVAAATPGGGLFGPLISAPTLSGSGLTTALNQSGTYSATNVSTGISITDSTGTSGENVEGIMQPYPGVPFTVTALFSLPQDAANAIQINICAAAALSANKMMLFGARWSNNVPGAIFTGWQTATLNYSTPTTFNAFTYGPDTLTIASTYIWYRYKDNGTNITFYQSNDGVYFQQKYTVTKASAYLSGNFNYIGACIDTSNSATGTTLQSWTLTTP